MSKECKRFVNRVADLIARKRKERYCDVVRHVRTRIRFAMLRTTLIALRGYRGKKMDSKYEKPLSEVSYNLIPAPMMEQMCIYLIFDISYYIILVAVDNFRYLCIVLCQLQHLNYFIVYILFDIKTSLDCIPNNKVKVIQ